MYNIGDKLKFTRYLPINYAKAGALGANGIGIGKTLSGRRIRGNVFRPNILRRADGISEYSAFTISEDKPMEGIYVGKIKRKLKRIYNRNAPQRGMDEIRALSSTSTRSTVSHRVDNPAELDTVVLLSIRDNCIIGVPLNNIVQHNVKFKVL